MKYSCVVSKNYSLRKVIRTVIALVNFCFIRYSVIESKDTIYLVITWDAQWCHTSKSSFLASDSNNTWWITLEQDNGQCMMIQWTTVLYCMYVCITLSTLSRKILFLVKLSFDRIWSLLCQLFQIFFFSGFRPVPSLCIVALDVCLPCACLWSYC